VLLRLKSTVLGIGIPAPGAIVATETPDGTGTGDEITGTVMGVGTGGATGTGIGAAGLVPDGTLTPHTLCWQTKRLSLPQVQKDSPPTQQVVETALHVTPETMMSEHSDASPVVMPTVGGGTTTGFWGGTGSTGVAGSTGTAGFTGSTGTDGTGTDGSTTSPLGFLLHK